MSDRDLLEKNNNEEVEIDLIEIWHELVNKKMLIAKVIGAFVVAAAAYSFLIAKPVYQTTALISVPNTVNGTQLNSFAAILKSNDPGNGVRVASAFVVKNSYVLQLTLEGNDPAKLKSVGTEYTKSALKQVNDTVAEQKRQQYSKDIINMIRGDITYISARLHESAFTDADGNSRLQYLIEKIERNEANYVFPEAKIAKLPEEPTVSVRPNRTKNISMGLVAGLMLGCGYVIADYLRRKFAR